jgi:hypothetical protein
VKYVLTVGVLSHLLLDPNNLQQDEEDNQIETSSEPKSGAYYPNQEDSYKRLIHLLFTLGGNIYCIGGHQSHGKQNWLGKTNISEPMLLLDDFQDLMFIQTKSRNR